jgi:hypothetical protein
MSDDDRPAFPAPRPRSAGPDGDRAPAKVTAPAPTIVRRPDAPPEPKERPAKGGEKPKLTPEEIRALLDVSTDRGYQTSPWVRRLALGPAAGGVIWLVRRLFPWPITALLVAAWIALVAWEVRRYVLTTRRW